MSKNSIKIFCPAKVNLFLQITRKRDDGYHALQSLIAFADFGDDLTITPADDFKFTMEGDGINDIDLHDNLITRAATLMSATLDQRLSCHIHLNKHIPIGAGLGGGSANAAGTIKGLMKFWDVELPANKQNNIAAKLGADVPMCLHDQPCFVEGIGELITPYTLPAPLPALLVYPNEFCSTAEIFNSGKLEFSDKISIPEPFKNTPSLINFLSQQHNDMTQAAINNVPQIASVLKIITQQSGCHISRMSGSGSCCFGIFETAEDVKRAEEIIRKQHPELWVRPCLLK